MLLNISMDQSPQFRCCQHLIVSHLFASSWSSPKPWQCACPREIFPATSKIPKPAFAGAGQTFLDPSGRLLIMEDFPSDGDVADTDKLSSEELEADTPAEASMASIVEKTNEKETQKDEVCNNHLFVLFS